MANLRMNQNLQAQAQVQLPAATLKVKPKEKEKDGVKKLEERVELVKAGKEDPNAVLADLGVKKVQVKNVGKNRQNLTFEVNGKRISVTGTSPEDLAAKAGELLADELGNDQNGEPAKSIGVDLIFIGILLLACWLKKKYPDRVDIQVR